MLLWKIFQRQPPFLQGLPISDRANDILTTMAEDTRLEMRLEMHQAGLNFRPILHVRLSSSPALAERAAVEKRPWIGAEYASVPSMFVRYY